MSLHDDQPLDKLEQRALARAFQTPEAGSWWDGLPPNTRRAIMQKLLSALANAHKPRDIGTLTRSLMKADELDLKRQQETGDWGSQQVAGQERRLPGDQMPNRIDGGLALEEPGT